MLLLLLFVLFVCFTDVGGGGGVMSTKLYIAAHVTHTSRQKYLGSLYENITIFATTLSSVRGP